MKRALLRKRNDRGGGILMRYLKRTLIVFVVILLTACAPDFSSPDEVIDETLPEDIGQETAIIPNYRVSESEYQVLLPYRLSQSRGVTTNQVANRFDITALENDLRRHSTSVFDPETHFFQEGQQIGQRELYSWLERESESTALEIGRASCRDGVEIGAAAGTSTNEGG